MTPQTRQLIEYHQTRADRYAASAKTAWLNGLHQDEVVYREHQRRHLGYIETIRSLVEIGREE